ncbi:MAG: hypothetical protein QXT34_02625 [Candidatus Aenigmatarchaeota archaeon]
MMRGIILKSFLMLILVLIIGIIAVLLFLHFFYKEETYYYTIPSVKSSEYQGISLKLETPRLSNYGNYLFRISISSNFFKDVDIKEINASVIDTDLKSGYFGRLIINNIKIEPKKYFEYDASLDVSQYYGKTFFCKNESFSCPNGIAYPFGFWIFEDCKCLSYKEAFCKFRNKRLRISLDYDATYQSYFTISMKSTRNPEVVHQPTDFKIKILTSPKPYEFDTDLTLSLIIEDLGNYDLKIKKIEIVPVKTVIISESLFRRKVVNVSFPNSCEFRDIDLKNPYLTGCNFGKPEIEVLEMDKSQEQKILKSEKVNVTRMICENDYFKKYCEVSNVLEKATFSVIIDYETTYVTTKEISVDYSSICSEK